MSGEGPAGTPRVVLLDVMGTLVHDPFFAEIPRFFGLALEELIGALQPGTWVEFEHGRIDEATALARFFADGRSFDGEGLKRAMGEAYRFLPGIEPLLVELRERGVTMHSLSNYPQWYTLVEQQVGLSRYMSWDFVSCRTGLRKPDPACYQHVVRALGVEPGECVFVDDRRSNCAAAREQGMVAIRFESARLLRRSLVELGLLPKSAPDPAIER